MKSLHEPSSFNTQLSNLKTSLTVWDELINKSGKFTTSLGSTINCMSAFLEAFQKISDMAQINNSGLQQLGIAMSRFCLRQRNMESRLKTFNSQINDCLVNPLSDRMEEWRRTSNQLDRDCVKEIRKAKSELQRAVLEAEKCKKRLRRKQDRGGGGIATSAFVGDHSNDFAGEAVSSVQVNFTKHDLECKQRALEQLEQRCQQAIAAEERRRFAEFTTCLEPVLEAQLGVLAECELLEHAVNAIRASCTAGPGVPPSSSSSSQANGGGFRLPTTPLVVGSGSSNTSSGHSVEQPTRATAPLLDPAIATGSAALSFAATQLPLSSQLSIASTTTTTTTGVGGLFGCSGVTDSVTTLHSQPPPPPPAPPAPTGLGSVVAIGSPGPESLLNGGGDALSLFDHNQSISGGDGTTGMMKSGTQSMCASSSSSSSLGLLPISCDGGGSGVGSVVGSISDSASLLLSASSCGIGPDGIDMLRPHPPARSCSMDQTAGVDGGEDEEEDEDGGTTEGCLTEDDDDDDVDENDQTVRGSSTLPHPSQQPTSMEKSILYPNQALPPPLYTNFSQLHAASQRGIPGERKASVPSLETPVSHADSKFQQQQQYSGVDARKHSQPVATATISKAGSGMSTLLRSLSISGGTRSVVPPPLPGLLGDHHLEGSSGEDLGAGEGLGLSPPPSALAAAPVIADQTGGGGGGGGCGDASISSYSQARSRIDAIFSNVETGGLRRGLNKQSTPPTSPTNATDGLGGGDPMDGTSTFSRRGRHAVDSYQPRQRTASINMMMRGSMFQLNTTSAAASAAAADTDFDGSGGGTVGYGYRNLDKQPLHQPMTPGPGRRAPLRSQISTEGYGGCGFGGSATMVRPPRRSSSVSRELPSLSRQPIPLLLSEQQQQQRLLQQHHQQQQQQQQQQQRETQLLLQQQHEQMSGAQDHYAAATAPRGLQQLPQRVYADPRAFHAQPICSSQAPQNGQQQQPASSSSSTTPGASTAAQLAAEAAALRRQVQQQQQFAPPSSSSTSGLRAPSSRSAISPPQLNGGQSRLPQRHSPSTISKPTAAGGHANLLNQHHPAASGSQLYRQVQQPQPVHPTYGMPNNYHHGYAQKMHNHHQQQQQQQNYPPPPAEFEDVETTSFIETSPHT